MEKSQCMGLGIGRENNETNQAAILTRDADRGDDRDGHHRGWWPLRFNVALLLTFLLVSLDSQHIATDRWASSPT
jgi:hypothetical protein